MWAAKAPRSTARALPAGTRVARAAAMIRELSRRISSLSSPTALSTPSARRELLHTSSPKNGDWCAGENFWGFISKRRTRTPRRAACQAASLPARPPPMMVRLRVFGFRFSVFGGHALVMGNLCLHRSERRITLTLTLSPRGRGKKDEVPINPLINNEMARKPQWT